MEWSGNRHSSEAEQVVASPLAQRGLLWYVSECASPPRGLRCAPALSRLRMTDIPASYPES